MSRKEARISQIEKPAASREDLARNTRIGRIASVDDEGVVKVWVDVSHVATARVAIAASLEDIKHALDAGQPVLLLLEEGDADRPVIIGLIEDRVKPGMPKVVEADVDGKRVKVVAKDEIVLECGNASITLRRNGRVVIKGTYVETQSEGTNRIKGGQVRIN